MNSFYITTAIDYPNAKPHLGHAYEKVCADVLARWHRLLGENVFFLTGVDEHGLKIERTAKKLGLTPKEFVDSQVIHFKELCNAWNISFDKFIRTTDKEHEVFVKNFFEKIFRKKDIYLGEYEGLYCTSCETFYTEKDLVNGLCPIHKTKPERVKEQSYFFKLSKYQKQWLKFVEENPEFISPKNKRLEIINRVKEGLRDLSVSRTSFDWGVKVPFDSMHVIYVWFDALLNYLSGVSSSEEEFNEFWPANIHLIGKDILWHHSVIWPIMLMASGFALPKKVFVHGFINTDSGEKMSKSLGTIINPMSLVKEFPSDVLRYYLIREIPFGSDGFFSKEKLVNRLNTELANDLGNLVTRVFAMVEKYFNGVIPNGVVDVDLEEKLDLNLVKRQMSELDLTHALESIMGFVISVNKYVNEKEPWKIKGKELDNIIYSLLDAIRIISILINPFMPETSEKILKSLNLNEIPLLEEARFGLLKKNVKLNNPGLLFEKVVLKKRENVKKISVSFSNDFKKLGSPVVFAKIHGVKVVNKKNALEKIKSALEKEIKKTSYENNKVLNGYDELYSSIGLNPSEFVTPGKKLVKLVKKNGKFPKINSVVDAYNVVSAKYLVAVGVHDLDKISGGVKFHLTSGGEKFVPLNKEKPVKVNKGEFAFSDDKEILCRLDVMQCNKTKVSKQTKNLLVYVQGNKQTSKKYLNTALKEICELITKFNGGEYEFIQSLIQ